MALVELGIMEVTCPPTRVRTGLALERHSPGDLLTVRCAPGSRIVRP